MRKTLMSAFPSAAVGAGGTFLVRRGRVKIHVMPEYSSCPLLSDEDVERWLNFYEAEAPFVCMSTFISRDPVRGGKTVPYLYCRLGMYYIRPHFQGLDLRVEHTHGFGEFSAGHYHCDVSPDDIDYLGYFNLAEGKVLSSYTILVLVRTTV